MVVGRVIIIVIIVIIVVYLFLLLVVGRDIIIVIIAIIVVYLFSVLLVDFIVLVCYCSSTLQKYSDIIVPARKNRKNFHSLPIFFAFCNMEIAI